MKGSEMESDDVVRGSQAVHRVLRVLLCWKDDAKISLTEISKRTGLKLPTAHRMLSALQREGFLVDDSVSGQYALGPAIFQLARTLLNRGDPDELVVLVIPHFERMRSITGETVGLHLLLGEYRMCAVELVSRQGVRTASGVGQTFRIPNGASGKILVAWSPEEIEMLKHEDGVTSRDHAELVRLLTVVRKNGYAISHGETIPGASGLALPVFGPNGDVRASINVTGPSARWTEKQMLSFLPLLLQETAQISEKLGFKSHKATLKNAQSE